MTPEEDFLDESESTENNKPFDLGSMAFGAGIAFCLFCLVCSVAGAFKTTDIHDFVKDANCSLIGHVSARYESRFYNYQQYLSSTPSIEKVENAYSLYVCPNEDRVQVHEK